MESSEGAKLHVYMAGRKGSQTQFGATYAEDGDWIKAAERLYNDAIQAKESERWFLMADHYLGGVGPTRLEGQPFGRHTVRFARYDSNNVRYVTDEPITVYVTREGPVGDSR